MPALTLVVADLQPFAPDIDVTKAEAMIDDALAVALIIAPCLGSTDPDFVDPYRSAAKAIVRGAILRWNEAGTGAFQQQTTGPFGEIIDTRQPRRSMYWPSEIEQLQNICQSFSGADAEGAFSIDTAPTGTVHADICTANSYFDEDGVLVFGGAYCSCGADIAGYPIYEVDPLSL